MSQTPTLSIPLAELGARYGLSLAQPVRLPLANLSTHLSKITEGLSAEPVGSAESASLEARLSEVRRLMSDTSSFFSGSPPPSASTPSSPPPTAKGALPARAFQLTLPLEFQSWHITCDLIQKGAEALKGFSVYCEAPLRGLRLNEEVTLSDDDLLTPPHDSQSDDLDPLCVRVEMKGGQRAALMRDDGSGLMLALDQELEVALIAIPRSLRDLPEGLLGLMRDQGERVFTSVIAQIEALGELWRTPLGEGVGEEIQRALDDLGVWSELCTQAAVSRCERLVHIIDELDELDVEAERESFSALLTALVEGRERLACVLAAEDALELKTPTSAAVARLDERARSLLSRKINELAWRDLPRPALRTRAARGRLDWWRALARGV
jgi:hypothetical protein